MIIIIIINITLTLSCMSTHTTVVHTLYNDHYSWLRSWLGKNLGNYADAADLAHDTFVRVLSKNDVGTLETPRAFLRTVARGLVIDHWRRKALENAYCESIARLSEDEVPSAESRVMIMELLERVACMLEGLKPRVRMAFLLVQCQGVSYAQAAGQLGVSQRSAERYVAEALYHCYMLRIAD